MNKYHIIGVDTETTDTETNNFIFADFKIEAESYDKAKHIIQRDFSQFDTFHIQEFTNY